MRGSNADRHHQSNPPKHDSNTQITHHHQHGRLKTTKDITIVGNQAISNPFFFFFFLSNTCSEKIVIQTINKSPSSHKRRGKIANQMNHKQVQRDRKRSQSTWNHSQNHAIDRSKRHGNEEHRSKRERKRSTRRRCKNAAGTKRSRLEKLSLQLKTNFFLFLQAYWNGDN
jgi:hypothetical protein